jgi:hypothetical protein
MTLVRLRRPKPLRWYGPETERCEGDYMAFAAALSCGPGPHTPDLTNSGVSTRPEPAGGDFRRSFYNRGELSA